jgi:hypothetical protein
MRGSPLPQIKVVLQNAVLGRPMVEFANEANRQLIATVARHPEPDRIGGALFRQPGAAGRIPEIAEFANFIEGRF